MTNFSKDQESFISSRIENLVAEAVAKLRTFYMKIVGGLGVVILLETGALIWTLAIGKNDNLHQDEAIKELTRSVNEYVKSTDGYMETLTKTTIENAQRTEANKNRLDRSPY